MSAFRAWCADYGFERPEKPNAFGISPGEAAESWFERKHSHLDWCSSADISVEDERGKRFEFTVDVEQVPVFRARRREQVKP